MRNPLGDATDGQVLRIAGERRRWPWLVLFVAVLTIAGVGTTYSLGYDVLRPLRGVILPAHLREDTHEALPVSGNVEPRLSPRPGLASAEREREAPSAEPSSSPVLTPSFDSERRNAQPATEPPDEPPARPSPDNPYEPPAAP